MSLASYFFELLSVVNSSVCPCRLKKTMDEVQITATAENMSFFHHKCLQFSFPST